MTAPQSPHRLEELDSLRGVAAMVVVFFHIDKFWYTPHPAWWRAMLASPLGVFMNGPDAVLLFFVLSGFVLYLPYLKPERSSGYPSFVVKRVCRIYLPYVAALVLAVVADWYLYHPLQDVSTDAMHWTLPFPWAEIVPHILFIGPTPNMVFNPVFWSLAQEMRISLVFPLIALLATRLRFAYGVLLGLGLCFVGLLPLLSIHYKELATVGYAGLFLVGASTARHLDMIRVFAARIGPYGRGFGFVLAFALLKSMHVLPERWRVFAAQATIHGAAAALIVVLALTAVQFKRLLRVRVLSWLGRVSYSLYLIHMTVLYTLISLFWARTSHRVWLMTLGVVLSLAAAQLFYLWVERPSMLLGRRLGGGRRRVETAPASTDGAVQGAS